ncbi:anthranilate synthase component II [Thalassomonas actiniarum]|uniref:Aminodeoxychorismate/anthranilate synthase component II n=1 Tax=Thalassomonas actiniarum TaxID=485447 RepID=A0AAF0C168_9GAMM|nr:aminodeoxychorismate/anthranilate synthase component II [Thalassomonas actiniarum]WDD98721.1 aminodeoxychorismate/anthranilate synthase component II [Thalassomonas actiniarum]
MLLMIDNYDSFTFNLVHYFQSLGQEVLVRRNDDLSLNDIAKLAPRYIVISPGPCTPDDAGISLEVVARYGGKVPLLGVCLGHQCIAQHFGAKVEKAAQVMHGKTSKIGHNNRGLFQGLKNPLQVTRYHSLIVNPDSLPECLEISAWYDNPDTDKREIMALQHKELAIASVQFHPESILTEQGHTLLENFLNRY